MKKWFALVLALVTMMMGSLALAEEVPAADAAQDAAALEELKAEGQLIQGESFEFYIPADWTDVELNDEQAAEGYVYAACSADEAQGLAVVWKELDAAQTAAEIQAGLVEVYENAQVQEINGISVVVFADAENDMLGICDAGQRGCGLLYVPLHAGFRRGIPADRGRDCIFSECDRGVIHSPFLICFFKESKNNALPCLTVGECVVFGYFSFAGLRWRRPARRRNGWFAA